MNKMLAGAALCAGMALGTSQLVGAGAGAGSYPPGGEELVVNVTVVTPGGTVTVTIRGCLVGEIVRFSIGNVSVDVTCTAGGAGDSRLMAPQLGSATATLQVPDTAGTYTITAVGLTSGFTETTTITVAAQDDDGDDDGDAGAGTGTGSDDTAGGLPATGTDTNGTLWIAGGALTAGLALSGVALSRRRRPAATA